MIKLLDFYADWCQPCKPMKAIIDNLEKTFPKVVITRIDVDKHSDIQAKYGVMSIPTVIIEKDEKEIKRFTGVTKERDIAQFLND